MVAPILPPCARSGNPARGAPLGGNPLRSYRHVTMAAQKKGGPKPAFESTFVFLD
jgi:hypothetical protein